ncbi:MAG: hypothetical protein MR521_07045, partial [Butyricicoccus sp.]|nr:hypothetical protein [Butyricicoccus sp.]
ALRKFYVLTLLRFHGNTSSITAKPRLVSTQNLLANRSCSIMRYCLKSNIMLIALFSSFIQGAPSKATPTEYDFVVRVAESEFYSR